MKQENNAEQLARIWIEGWISGTPDDLPLADDFIHSSPFGVVEGREKYLAWVKPLSAKNVNTLKIIKTLGNNSEAVIWFEMVTPKGMVLCCDWISVKDGTIKSVQSFYDASLLR